eukprot:823637-Ditylum_brightwellii.AAC.1
MQLSIDSDTTNLVMPGAKSLYAGHFYLESSLNSFNYKHASNNAPIHTKCKALKNEMGLVAKVECSGIFHYGQLVVMIRGLLQQMGFPKHPQKARLTIQLQKPLCIPPCVSKEISPGMCIFIGYRMRPLNWP